MTKSMRESSRRTVQLLHTLPGGAAHIDWMIAQDDPPRQDLTTFRTSRRIDELRAGERIEAERIPDHRAAYLEYEGPVSGGRGEVRRVCQGIVLASDQSPEGDSGPWTLDISWRLSPQVEIVQRLRIEKLGENPLWMVICISQETVAR